MYNLTIVVPIMGGFGESRPFWGCLLNMVQGPDTDLRVIDNTGYDEGQKEYLERFVFAHWNGKTYYDQMEDNLGMIKSMQHAYEKEREDKNRVLAFVHNDLYIYQLGWDNLVKEFMRDDIGILGFFGGEHCGLGGGRLYNWSNMLDAESHGGRNTGEHKEVAVLDGMTLMTNIKMLDVKDGFDLDYDVHHFYDADICLESLDRGFKNYSLNFPVHHQGGLTACRGDFQEWANKYVGHDGGEQVIYSKNRDLFERKWNARLPYHVTEKPYFGARTNQGG